MAGLLDHDATAAKSLTSNIYTLLECRHRKKLRCRTSLHSNHPLGLGSIFCVSNGKPKTEKPKAGLVKNPLM
jgi:hypothetical protein